MPHKNRVKTFNTGPQIGLDRKMFISAGGLGKVGGTAGWVVAAADNLNLVTLPASQTGSKLIIPVPSLIIGTKVKAFHLVGQVESGGNNVTLDADLRKMTSAAADVADASIGAMTQLVVAVDTILGAANTRKVLTTPEEVAVDESLYMVITGTTLGATDVALQGIVLELDALS